MADKASHKKERIWEQLPDEGAIAYRNARVFFELGPRRTLIRANKKYREIKRQDQIREDGIDPGPVTDRKMVAAPGATMTLCKRHNWWARAAAYDAYFQNAKDRAAFKAIEANALAEAKVTETFEAKRIRLRQDNNENGILIADRLTVKAIEILQWPMSQETTTSTTTDAAGHSTTVVKTVEPIKWTMGSAVQLLQMAKTIRDAALGLTPNTSPGVSEPPPPEVLGMSPIRSVTIRLNTAEQTADIIEST